MTRREHDPYSSIGAMSRCSEPVESLGELLRAEGDQAACRNGLIVAIP
ncbi:MAG: hypothetical protein QOH13_2675 [Thermoleophilaceae bacterium]|jgi:hypothetical protein|nr:hypothetical protein [Thermoleophilaceae bacterium]